MQIKMWLSWLFANDDVALQSSGGDPAVNVIFNGKVKCGIQGKLAAKSCARF